MKTAPYYDLRGVHLALIGKCGCSAIGKAVALKLTPHFKIVSASGSQANIDRMANGPGLWQRVAPKTTTPTSPIIPVRDPVERFRSACAQESVEDVDAVLARLENEPIDNLHYRPTSDWLVEGATLYKFPEHIREMEQAAGLHIEQINAASRPKPELTPEQEHRVRAIYADDMALFDSISEAGQLSTPT